MTPEFINAARHIRERYGKGKPGESWFFVFSHHTGRHLFNIPGRDKEHALKRAGKFLTHPTGFSTLKLVDRQSFDEPPLRLERIASLDTSVRELFNPVADPDFVRNMKGPPRMKPRPITSRMEPRPITPKVARQGGFFG
jgi:hypothetical protein